MSSGVCDKGKCYIFMVTGSVFENAFADLSTRSTLKYSIQLLFTAALLEIHAKALWDPEELFFFVALSEVEHLEHFHIRTQATTARCSADCQALARLWLGEILVALRTQITLRQ